MNPGASSGDRLDDLLADRALQGLSDEETAELGQLAADLESEGLALELAAAEVELALDHPPFPSLPPSLRRRVEADAEAYFAHVPDGQYHRKLSAGIVPWLGWVAAAASLLYAVSLPREVPRPPEPPKSPGLVERLASAPPRPLAQSNHPLARGAGGSLVWSPQRQEGYLKVEGLAEVDPTRGIYQLWIFDASRDERFPIDGGTFTVDDARQPTIVPIHPLLAVREPTLFAVTLEPPGGVVVSDRKRILLTAAITP